MKYTTLFFDADGTLYDFKDTEEGALESFYRKCKVNCPYEIFLKTFDRENRLLWSALEKGETTAERVKVDRFVNTMTSLDLYEGNGEELSSVYIEELALRDRLLPGAEELIESLGGKFSLYLVTNGLWDVQRRRLGGSELYRKHFSGLIVSEKVGSAKPSPRIFDEAFRIAGNPEKSEVLMIGDSLTSDIRGGDLYGIDTCWYNPEGKVLTGPSKPTYMIKDLAEIGEILSAG